MSKERIEKGLEKFYEEMDKRLGKLWWPREERQYLEGLVHAFDAIIRLAKMPNILPLERKNFIASAKSHAILKIHDLDMEAGYFKRDPESKGWSPIF